MKDRISALIVLAVIGIGVFAFFEIQKSFTWNDIQWKIVNTPKSTLRSIHDIESYREDKYLLATRKGLFITNSDGDEYRIFDKRFDGEPIMELHRSGNKYLIATNNMGFYLYDDDTASLKEINDGLARYMDSGKMVVDTITSFAQDSKGNVYAGSVAGLLYKLKNWNRWQVIRQDVDNSLSQIMFSGNDIYISTSNGIYRSEDDGKTWKKLPVGKKYDENYQLQIVKFDNAIAVAGELIRNGEYISFVKISKDKGNTWTDISPKIRKNTFFSIETFRNDLFIGAEDGIYSISKKNINLKDISNHWEYKNNYYLDNIFLMKAMPDRNSIVGVISFRRLLFGETMKH